MEQVDIDRKLNKALELRNEADKLEEDVANQLQPIIEKHIEKKEFQEAYNVQSRMKTNSIPGLELYNQIRNHERHENGEKGYI